jgi:hypothetical protein
VRRRRRGAALARAFVLLVTVAVLAGVVPTLFIAVRCVRPGVAPPPRAPEVERVVSEVRDYFRGGAATYLTVPEWYIVYSTEEYARWLRTRPPSGFPYLSASRQYWDYYGAMCDATRNAYPFDAGVHLMLGVIGVSFTAENTAKAIYENTVGRLTEWTSGHATAEDAFAHRTNAEYGRFMHTVPWYQFPFGGKVVALWRETPLWGPGLARKWERRAALTAEYTVKAGYAWLIRWATGTVYAPEDARIHAWVSGAPAALQADQRVGKVKELPGGASIVALPRYEAFTEIVHSLVIQGVRFRDIAGNDSIVMTAIVKRAGPVPTDIGEVLFTAPILTDPAATRIVVRTPVGSLYPAHTGLERAGARLEHLYDY